MKKLLLPIFAFLLLSAGSDKPNENAQVANTSRSETATPSAPDKPKVGDTVIYQSGSAQRFYEAKLLSIDGTRAKLQGDFEAVEVEMTDVYAVPNAGNKITAQAGDIVAARFGRTKVWPGAEVVNVGEKVKIKWLSTGNTDEVSPENVLMLSPSVGAKVKASFPARK